MLGETISNTRWTPTLLSSRGCKGSPRSGPQTHGRCRDSCPIPSSVPATPTNSRGDKRFCTLLTRQEKDYKRLITEIDGEVVIGTGIVREVLRRSDRPTLGQGGVARDKQNERLTEHRGRESEDG